MLNQQPAEPRPESFLQLCHHINQLGHGAMIPGSLLPPLASAGTQAASQTGELMGLKNDCFVLSGTFSDEPNALTCLAKRKWECGAGDRGGRLN